MAGDGAHQRWEGRRGGAGSRRAPLLVVAAIVAAGVIDGVARAVNPSPNHALLVLLSRGDPSA
jgi:hypothetical protein